MAISADILDWGRECFVAGDGLDAIAEGSGYSVEAWRQALGLRLPDLSRPNRARNLRILALWNDGYTNRQIAATEGITRQAIWNVIAKMRLEGEEAPLRPAHWISPFTVVRRAAPPPPSARNLKIIPLMGSGLSAREVADLCGCSRNAVLGVWYRARQAKSASRQIPQSLSPELAAA